MTYFFFCILGGLIVGMLWGFAGAKEFLIVQARAAAREGKTLELGEGEFYIIRRHFPFSTG